MTQFALDEGTTSTQEMKVSEVAQLIKRTIDDNFGYVRVKGEVSGLKIASSGHAYFNLKDEGAVLACTCWRPVIAKINFSLEDGKEVIVSGRLSTYPLQSRYQLNAERIEESGKGALMETLLKRKAQFEKEGLFDPARKKKLPFFPKKIGVITSPTGAVIQDIIHRVKDRCPTHILLWPVAVQGESCAFEVSSAINGFNHLDEDLRPNVLIVARGGGSIEDLWGFNEEIVVRAAANSAIPIISAVGHETDFTLIDFVSSVRAPTPTAAAEFAVPVLSDLKFMLNQHYSRVNSVFSTLLKSFGLRLKLAISLLSFPDKLIFPKQQILDDLSFRLNSSLPNHLKLKFSALKGIELPLNAIYNLIFMKSQKLTNQFDMANFVMKQMIAACDSKLELNSKLLASLSIDNILKRGFTIVKSGERIITSAEIASNASELLVEWHDGKLHTKIIK